jgi:hypothetical protein
MGQILEARCELARAAVAAQVIWNLCAMCDAKPGPRTRCGAISDSDSLQDIVIKYLLKI